MPTGPGLNDYNSRVAEHDNGNIDLVIVKLQRYSRVSPRIRVPNS